MEWGSEGYGHENGEESIHKWLTRYKGILIAKEKSNKSKPIYYIEDVKGDYTDQHELKNVIDIIIGQYEGNK